MTWKQFVCRWRPVDLTRIGIPHRTVYDWRTGGMEPKGWKREAVEFWIEAKAGEPIPSGGKERKAAVRPVEEKDKPEP
jgi:hypothetical protein